MKLRDRKRLDLKRRLSAIKNELQQWEERSLPGKELRKHHSQIARLSSRLRAFSAALESKLDGGSDPLAEGQALELASLELHRIWEFFRSKLAQRTVSWYHPHLAAADELAWACYAPVRDLAVKGGGVAKEAVVEPPLVFFNGAASPISMSRDVQFGAEVVPSGRPISTDEFKELLKKLPVPVIGIPWFQIEHLPDALLTCHEVGHQIEDNLGLTRSIDEAYRNALESVDVARRPAWQAWGGEVFADLYGVLTAGPAFVDALVRAIAVSPKEIAEETRTTSDMKRYPTKMLRALLSFTALEHLGFTSEATELRDEWSALGTEHAMPAFEADMNPIVAALFDAPHEGLGAISLRTAISFKKENQQAAVHNARSMQNGIPPASQNVREIFAAAAILYRTDPEAYAKRKAGDLALEKIQKLQDDKIRAYTRAPAGDPRTADELGGDELFREVWRLLTSTP